MSKRTYEELRDMLRHELDVLTKKGEVTKESLDYFHKLTSTLYKLDGLMKAEESEEGGYSQRGGNYSGRYMRPMGSYNSYDGQSMTYGNSMNPYGNSMNYGTSRDGNSYNTSYDGGNSRDDGASRDGRQGRDADSDGRYSETSGDYSRRRDARGRYSRHTEKEKMIEKLERMADSATNSKERNAIMECIEELEGQ